jgi:penicillin amidase
LSDYLGPTDSSATFSQILWSQLYTNIWQDDIPPGTKYPSSELTVQLLLSDSTSNYYDDKRTQQVETIRDIVQRAFRQTTDSLDRLQHSNTPTPKASNAEGIQREASNLEWYKVKNTSLTHLAKIPAFSYDHLKIGGWSNTINACTHDHGPSWRMIVEMDSIPRAYTIYPGGQSGNPGSPYYSDFIQQWVEGKYHAAQFITANTTKNPLKYTWTLSP